jgi:hypothetical protein
MHFFRKTSRINAVIFIWEVLSRIGRGAAVTALHRPITHPNPRRPAPLDFLFGERHVTGYSLPRELQRPSGQFVAQLEAGELPISTRFLRGRALNWRPKPKIKIVPHLLSDLKTWIPLTNRSAADFPRAPTWPLHPPSPSTVRHQETPPPLI